MAESSPLVILKCSVSSATALLLPAESVSWSLASTGSISSDLFVQSSGLKTKGVMTSDSYPNDVESMLAAMGVLGLISSSSWQIFYDKL